MADSTFTHLVVVGSSAGGIGALSGMVSSLPEDFDAPIVVAQHLDPNRESHLQEILARKSTLPVKTVTEHEPLQAGMVFVVPSNRHVNITDSEIDEDDGRGFEENGHGDAGLGLRSIKERAALLDGTARVYSSPQGGAGVRVLLPLLGGGG